MKTSGPTAVNWEEVRRRLAEAHRALDESENLTPEQARAVMDERARQLARRPEVAPDASEMLEVATFSMGAERHALETRFIQAVVRPYSITPAPGAPPFLCGVTNLRGEVLAVFDLRWFLSDATPSPRTIRDEQGDASQLQVLVVGNDQAEFGLLADDIHDVLHLRIDQVHAAPGASAGVSPDFLRGVTSDGLLVLDGESLLADQRLFIDDPDRE